MEKGKKECAEAELSYLEQQNKDQARDDDNVSSTEYTKGFNLDISSINIFHWLSDSLQSRDDYGDVHHNREEERRCETG